MGVRLSWAEARKQEAELQSLMMEVLACEQPQIGLLIHAEEPDLFIQTINRAKSRDPLLAPIEVRMTAEGIALVYQQEGKGDDQED